jgi:hypothetical protein
MEQIDTHGDERNLLYCLYCGDAPDSREHVPSRVLLDKPYPENLPIVGACRPCNGSFSRDEEYLACAVAVALAGSVDPARVERQKVQGLLTERPALTARLSAALHQSAAGTTLNIEQERVRNVLTKLARGHAFFELGEPVLDAPVTVAFAPLHILSLDARRQFEVAPASTLWPPPGSRAMLQLIETWPTGQQQWVVVQPERYRYAVSAGPLFVRLVLSEYLACEVTWD